MNINLLLSCINIENYISYGAETANLYNVQAMNSMIQSICYNYQISKLIFLLQLPRDYRCVCDVGSLLFISQIQLKCGNRSMCVEETCEQHDLAVYVTQLGKDKGAQDKKQEKG